MNITALEKTVIRLEKETFGLPVKGIIKYFKPNSFVKRLEERIVNLENLAKTIKQMQIRVTPPEVVATRLAKLVHGVIQPTPTEIVERVEKTMPVYAILDDVKKEESNEPIQSKRRAGKSPKKQ
jgi:hypothetical protein